jgi:hypothetical protein
MNQSQEKNPETVAADNQRPLRRSYEKPEVRFERVFETMALSCGKVQATQGSCRRNRKAS